MKKVFLYGAICGLATGCISGYEFEASAQTANSEFVINNGILHKYNGEDEVVTIPSNVTKIDICAFTDNKKITKVIIPGNVKIISSDAFSFCENLQEVVINEGVEEIDDNVFGACENLKKINIPSSINRIGCIVFSGCKNLNDIQFSTTTNNIESNAFYSTPWIENVKDENGFTILNNVLLSVETEKTDVVVPDGIEIIGSQAFEKVNETIESVTFPDSLKEIKSDAFSYCVKLNNVVIPDKVTTIGNGAFQGCTSLSSVKLGKSVEKLEHYALDAPNLKSLSIPSSLKEIELTSIPDNVNIVGDKAAYEKAYKSAQIREEQNLYVDVHRYSNGWHTTIDNKTFYIESDNLKTGWMDLDGKRYYFYSNGRMATSFTDVGGTKYYFNPKAGEDFGNMLTGWQKINNKWYYFSPTAQGNTARGFMKTSWLNNGGNWYYLYSDGTMATGFINLNGAYYYLNNSGAMVSGWQKIDGSWYYFNQPRDGGIYGLMSKGWKKINGKWYYFYESNGKMAQNTWIGGYHVNSNGEWDR